MENWKKIIVSGNEFFESENLTASKVQYRNACQRALQLLHDWIDAEEAVAALIVSYQNMANLCLKEKQSYQAQLELEHLYGLILEALSKPGLFKERQLAFMGGLHKARSALLIQVKEYGSKLVSINYPELKYSDNKF